MAANPTIYCLEQVTDYFEFERLCHDLMSLEGYSSVEPLGGSKDKGRDAIYVNESDKTSIFAYSVREEWRVKLAEDAEKVHEHRHTCNQFIFITTAKFTAYQRDEAVAYIKNEFGWQLELFGVERLRILLDVSHPQIKQLHPGIFPPEFLAAQNQIDGSTKRNHLFISSVDEDKAFADWLTRKLIAEGYLVWYEPFKLLGGETYPDDVDDAIKNQTFRFISLYSRASVKDPEVTRQRLLALNARNEQDRDFLIPLNVDGVDQTQLDQVTRTLKFIPFQYNWAEGLKQLLEKLESIDCPRPLPNGKRIAAEAFLGNDVRSEKKEILFSNCLQIHQIPEIVHRFTIETVASKKDLDKLEFEETAISENRLDELRFEWSYRRVDPNTFLSFHKPPVSIFEEYRVIEDGGAMWLSTKKIDGISSFNLVSELIRKALIVKCYQKGLRYCPDTKLLYFPSDLIPKKRLYFTRPDDRLNTYVNATGRRKYLPESEYLYSLAPSFFVRQDLFDNFTVLIRIRIRLSSIAGKAFTAKRTIDSRRKHLCKNWWNKEWFNRTLAVSQFLADEDRITIGEPQEAQIVIGANPLHLSAPVGINEAALSKPSAVSLNIRRI